MKANKIIIAAAIVAGSISVARADNPGCGLGSVIFSGQRGLIFDLGASFTNGIFLNQAFGMSTGTLGCKQNARIDRRELFAYVHGNYESFAMEAAAGTKGESMIAAAAIVGMDADKFATLMHDNFDKVFGAKADASEATNRIYALIG
ncbi:MAG: DUF3015 domain-containing protein [Rickettsiales bacterium]|jgi:hypothetical protein|nr:DUF3015 domain-containing protein [Rickettsiales bacterium]